MSDADRAVGGVDMLTAVARDETRNVSMRRSAGRMMGFRTVSNSKKLIRTNQLFRGQSGRIVLFQIHL